MSAGMAGRERQTASAPLWRLILLGAGTVLLALGLIGVFVPVLPTTPFLLLAAACFVRSSPRLHRWLLGNRLLGPYLRHYHEGVGVPLRTRLLSLLFLWLGLGYSLVYAVDSLLLRLLLLLIGIAVTVHITSLRPRRR